MTYLERLAVLEARRAALHGPGPEWHKPIEQRAEFKRIAFELLALARESGCEVNLPTGDDPHNTTKD